ncbi:MAG: hypothetical protein CMJ94_08105 [Planctomycetes bacterium]|nr:hypothetical protein [Planctomycetota bacterium]
MIDTLSLISDLLLSQTEAANEVAPWFSEEFGVYLGAYGGAGVGVLGGILGGVGGPLAQQGKGRGFVLPAFLVTAVVGVVLLAAGLVGLLVGQPYVVYYPFLLLGLIMSAVFGGLYPVMRTRYRQAETRKLEAEALRRA